MDKVNLLAVLSLTKMDAGFLTCFCITGLSTVQYVCNGVLPLPHSDVSVCAHHCLFCESIHNIQLVILLCHL